jgi:hypothetical protein
MYRILDRISQNNLTLVFPMFRSIYFSCRSCKMQILAKIEKREDEARGVENKLLKMAFYLCVLSHILTLLEDTILI